MRKIIAALFLAIATPAVATDADVREDVEERVEEIMQSLYQLKTTYCRPVGLHVHVHRGESIGLEEDDVAIMARSRMRSARIYNDTSTPMQALLSIVVLIGSDHPAYTYRVFLEKKQVDLVVKWEDWSPTGWGVWGFGLHGEDANYVMSLLTRAMDKFIDEYLETNRGGPCLGTAIDFDPFEDQETQRQ